MQVTIVKTAKSTMQSGRAKLGAWVIQPDFASPRAPEPLMGWTAAGDTLTTLKGKLQFDTAEQAAAYATQQGWQYRVQPGGVRKQVPRNYVQNFKYIPSDAE